MNKKLSDEEIIKSLENCVNGFDEIGRDNCDTYPYTEINLCGKAQMTDCLDLILRQKAEIEHLTEENAILKRNPPLVVGRSSGKTIRAKLLAFDRMKKQNDELQKQVDELKLLVKNMEQGYYPIIQLRENMEKEKQQLKDKIVELESENEKLKKDCADIANDYQEMGKFYYEESQKNQQLKDRIAELEEKLKEQ